MRLKITEIFHSIQGESSLAGERTSFVRLTGCPLRCTYCDTTYSYSGGSWMSISEIVQTVKQHQTGLVCITGGEPLAHRHTYDLVLALQSEGLSVSIETDGEENVSQYAKLDSVKLIMDIKTPASGVEAKICFENLPHLRQNYDEIKFVISDRQDYLWCVEVCKKYELPLRFCVLFSPVWDKLTLLEIASWILEDKLDVRLQTQLHKHIWGAETRGV